MKRPTRLIMIFAFLGCMALTSCSTRLVDFTAISSKQMNLRFDKSNGKRVEGSKSYFMSFGYNLKDALDRALQKAGPGYDLLIDGVVRSTSYPFVLKVSVEGTAINTSKMRNSMGKASYDDWLKKQDVFEAKESAIASSSDKN